MTQLGNVPEINELKKKMNEMKQNGLVKDWEIPYENLLTRLTAAILFLTVADNAKAGEVWSVLENNRMFHYRLNEDKKLSPLEWRVEFNKGFEL